MYIYINFIYIIFIIYIYIYILFINIHSRYVATKPLRWWGYVYIYILCYFKLHVIINSCKYEWYTVPSISIIDDVEVLKINCLFYIWLKGICSHDDISILIPNVYLITPLDHCIVFRIR